ncbi:MAG TPA: peptide chain release factor 1 [Candidatus Marinimicrobia bacterium]|jgi:peptide chain release factor 1|nr:peptide chain release factor 1 [Candidatus Neomarinimicrobiota bacterium]HJL85189.1 peptide chain release factor 1 [Candidatus Neomarinimicrobiota bacterium]|tara:strand:- start:287 stop:1351 length:1065 start_codon:yes stop_codon:yes gene_type:complete
MQNKIKEIIKTYDDFTDQLSDPEIISNPAIFREIAKQHHDLESVVLRGREYIKLIEQIEEYRSILGGDDPDLKAIVKEEFDDLISQQEQQENDLKLLLLPKDQRDSKNTIIEIRAGTGGEEAALFSADLYRMYSHYAERKGWTTETLSSSPTGSGGLKEVIFAVKGDGAFGEMKFEGGVHRVQRVPETESSGRIHTSAATVAILPEAEEIDLKINPDDIRIDTFRASGAGGQHVNKTESAVRITHTPTGLVVSCQDEKSQHKNRVAAMKVLRSRLLAQEEEKQQSERAEVRKSMVSTGDRSAKIRTYNFPQGRVTDHRIELTLYKLDNIMNGDISELIEQLRIAEQMEQLKQAA